MTIEWWARYAFAHPTILCPYDFLRGHQRLRTIGQPRGNADRGAAGRHVMLDDRAGADLGEIADADAADNARSGAEINAPADFRGTVRLRMFSADGDVLQNRHLVADHGEGADDDAGGVIEKDLRANRCGGMNADG